MAYTFKHGDRPLDDYTIQRAVGSGGFGEVYYAVSDGGREVALKYLKENPQIELRGVSHCINLKSPHLVSIFDVKKNADGDYFIIMEYCSGPSLRDMLIAEPKGFGPQKATFFVREIAKGLSYLHDRGIVHRDLKPGNLFYDDGYVKIGDYGLSKFISISRHSAQTASIGTVHYMAPEIGSGNYSHGVDIYALGVMLYEMLLGKVPFEGSSMAEVLMKHLTAQPELDELPHPFGDVIRKALEKDPANRYQTVNEMVESLLEVDEIKRSLDGFSIRSLEGAVRQGGAVPAPSPVPSPNPYHGARSPQPPPPPRQAPKSTELPKRVARVQDRISRKIAKRVAKLGGGKPPAVRPASSRATPKATPADWAPLPPLGEIRPARGQAIVMTVVLGIAIGALFANGVGGEVGASAGMMTVAMVLGLSIARRVVRWFNVPYGKNFSSRVIHAGCCAPLLGFAGMPMLQSFKYHDAGLAVWLGLMIVVVFADWRRHFERGLVGRVSFGSAIWVGFGALLATAIMGEVAVGTDAEDFVLFSAAVAGVVTLIAQATGSSAVALAGTSAPHPLRNAQEAGQDGAEAQTPEHSHAGPPVAVPVEGDSSMHAEFSLQQSRSGRSLERWGATRAFFGIISFGLVGGMISTILLAALADKWHHDEITGVVLGSIACGTMMLFTIRKTTPIRQPGFWREWLRPFLQTVSLFGIGGTTTGIAREFGAPGGTEVDVMLITGLVMSTLMFVIVSALRGKRREAAPFLTNQPDNEFDPPSPA